MKYTKHYRYPPNCENNKDPDLYRKDRCIFPPPSKRTLYRECEECHSSMVKHEGFNVAVAVCPNKYCRSNTPLTDIICGPPHMTGVCPGNCACDGRPWWWPGRSLFLDKP